MSQLTHINAAGEAHMVDVSAKAETVREARAEAFVTMQPATLAMPASPVFRPPSAPGTSFPFAIR